MNKTHAHKQTFIIYSLERRKTKKKKKNKKNKKRRRKNMLEKDRKLPASMNFTREWEITLELKRGWVSLSPK